MLIYKEDFCLPSNYPTYPPYAKGAYLEDYFAIRFASESKQFEVDREYIQVLWTSYYNQVRNDYGKLQKYLDTLDPSKKYFTVCQHDDAPRHTLPEDTLVFSAGGNYEGKNCIPIPLICSKIKTNVNSTKKYLISFVGSDTHPLRKKSVNSIKNKQNVFVKIESWSPTINDNNLKLFVDITKQSDFCLCPRGYGKSSFRMYEAMQLGSIPVYVSDKHYLPWSDELNWNDFSVIIDPNQINGIYEILNDITEDKKEKMRNNIKQIYDDYFSLSGMYFNILKRIAQ